MIYIDTSVWIAALCPEATSPAVTAWFQSQAADTLVASTWARVEIASALSIKARRGDIPIDSLAARHEKLRIMAALSMPWPMPETDDYEVAHQLCADASTKLRASDALHLAIAKRLKCTHLFTLDDVLHANAVGMGFKTMAL